MAMGELPPDLPKWPAFLQPEEPPKPGNVIDFQAFKDRPKKAPERLEQTTALITVKSPKPKPVETREKRKDKMFQYVVWINSQYHHKFTYPLLARHFKPDTHSFSILYNFCFDQKGYISKDTDDGTVWAKRWACERREEILDFFEWRISKYEEARALYGEDLQLACDHINSHIQARQNFERLFLIHDMYETDDAANKDRR